MLKVFHITNAHPYKGNPEYGCFIKEQIASVSSLVDNKIYFINAKEYGFKEYFKAITKLKHLCEEVDVVHCHHLFSLIVYRMSGGRKPVVLSFLNDWTREIELPIPIWIKELVCTLGIKFSDKVIFKSFPPTGVLDKKRKFEFLPNGVDTNYFDIIDRDVAKQELNLSEDCNYILFVSSKSLHRRQKRIDLFEQVIERVKIIAPELRVEPLMMSNDSREKARLKFNAASLHLLTSDYEGSPNSIKEALACGTPVVARDVGSTRSLILGGSESLVIDSANIEELASAVLTVLKQKIDRSRVRASIASSQYTKDKVKIKLINIYESLI